MSQKPHIEFSKIADLIDHRLPADETSSVLTHLAACPDCAAQHAKLERAVSLMQANELEDAPRYAVAKVVDLFKPRARQSIPLLKRLVGLLKFDSQQMMPAFGVRSGAAAERQMLFSAGDHELQLQITRADEGWMVSGQVLGDCDGGEIAIKNPNLTKQTALNELCEFTLPPVPAGNYALTLSLNHIEIEVSDLNLGA
ncbi:MAG: zf-HC2 domain-containing protein [Acidobacteriota bacterium]